jgi:hypothetical protein
MIIQSEVNWAIQTIMVDIKRLQMFCIGIFRFVNRQANYLAHNLASWTNYCNADGSVSISSLPLGESWAGHFDLINLCFIPPKLCNPLIGPYI